MHASCSSAARRPFLRRFISYLCCIFSFCRIAPPSVLRLRPSSVLSCPVRLGLAWDQNNRSFSWHDPHHARLPLIHSLSPPVCPSHTLVFEPLRLCCLHSRVRPHCCHRCRCCCRCRPRRSSHSLPGPVALSNTATFLCPTAESESSPLHDLTTPYAPIRSISVTKPRLPTTPTDVCSHDSSAPSFRFVAPLPWQLTGPMPSLMTKRYVIRCPARPSPPTLT